MRRNRFNIKITHALSYLNGKSCKCGVDKWSIERLALRLV
jgi:hypothetical protein